MKLIEKILSLRKDGDFKVLTILGIKIKKRFRAKVEDFSRTRTNVAFCLNNLRYTHERTFEQFKNINVGKEVAIIATGPSLTKYKPIEGCINIGLNRAYQFDKVKLDYLFMQDGNAVSSYIDEIDELENVIKFYGRNLFNENYRTGIRIPDYHLLNKNCYEYYSYGYYDAEIKPNIAVYPLFSSASVSFPAIHFALYTHPKRIYLVGCDTTSAPYWDGKGREQDFLNIQDKVTKMMLTGYFRIKQFVEMYYPDIEIVSVNPVGLKGMFKDIDI